jgi:ABC-type multidrug transport system fused ATPase/permease subunit
MERLLQKRDLLVSKGWLQAVTVVVLFGFFVLGLLAYRTYSGAAPIPGRVVDPEARVLFTRGDIQAGQQVFLRNGLMEYGSVLGHGAYLGPDYTADYLRRAALIVRDSYGGADSDRAWQQTAADFKENRYDPATGHEPVPLEFLLIKNLGKQYKIGAIQGKFHYNMFRDVIMDTLLMPVRVFQALRGTGMRGTSGTSSFWALKDISFDLEEGKVLGIVGRNGAGKSTTLRTISGIVRPKRGAVRFRRLKGFGHLLIGIGHGGVRESYS